MNIDTIDVKIVSTKHQVWKYLQYQATNSFPCNQQVLIPQWDEETYYHLNSLAFWNSHYYKNIL